MDLPNQPLQRQRFECVRRRSSSTYEYDYNEYDNHSETKNNNDGQHNQEKTK
jgi:hypothetical protein